MFTGIVESVGRIKRVLPYGAGKRLVIEATDILGDAGIGESVAINGVCLTVVNIENGLFEADVSQETLKRSNLGFLRQNDPVNIERALKVGDRLSGHIVLGHVDGMGRVVSVKREGEFFVFTISVASELEKYCVFKGSVAVDGISLTVAELMGGAFRVAVIPHTFFNTNLSYRKPGDFVNIETDIIGKYIERLMNRDKISFEMLKENGFI